MKKEGMTGPMAAWLDTSKPAPVRIKRKVDYLPPTNAKLVESLVLRVFEEEKAKKAPRPNLRAVRRLDGLVD